MSGSSPVVREQLALTLPFRNTTIVAASQRVTATGYALLGLLSFGRELTGYELKQWADDSLRFFYRAPAMSQVYRELAQLEAEGLVRARDSADGGRTIRTYRLSPAGRTELRRWLADAPLGATVFKHHLALRVFLGHLAEPGQLLRQIAEQRAWCEETLTDLAAVRERLAEDPDDVWGFARLVAEWGVDHYTSELRSLDRLTARVVDARGDLRDEVPAASAGGEDRRMRPARRRP
jgi:DNA-binding PadR family transcriptional regulator